ncbi:MAG TPA: hemolysin III family protein [Acidimicrobiia bacterium]|nr:hemolysin III family protein [Acidimicrobiia bacterium]
MRERAEAAVDRVTETAMATLGRMRHPVRGFLNGAAALAAVVGLVVLLVIDPGGVSLTVALSVYAGSLVAMFTISCLYHSVPWSDRWKRRMRRLDHSAIFLVVAGTYTPIAVVALDAAWRTASLTAVWMAAAVGIALKFVEKEIRLGPSVTIQSMMGWAAVIPMFRIADRVGGNVIVLLGIAGALYTVGMVFMLTGRPRLFPRVFSHHELFHVLVVAASAVNFAAILQYVIPAAA